MALDTAAAVATLRGLTAKFDNRLAAATPFYPQVSTIVTSQGADEEYGILGSLPGVREWLSDRQFKTLRAAKFAIENKKWESSLSVEKDHIDDDRLGMYGPLLEQLATEAAYHPDELFIQLLEAGDSSPCLDGQLFFDTDHVWGDSGTQSNDLTYDATDHTDVTADEFRDAFHLAVMKMFSFKRDNGKLYHRPIINEGTMGSLRVVVPPALWLAARTGLTAALVGGGNTNIVLSQAQITVMPGLSSSVKWWLLNTDSPLKPFIFQARKPLSRQMKGLDDMEFKGVKFMTEARYNMGYGAWWDAVQTEFN